MFKAMMIVLNKEISVASKNQFKIISMHSHLLNLTKLTIINIVMQTKLTR